MACIRKLINLWVQSSFLLPGVQTRPISRLQEDILANIINFKNGMLYILTSFWVLRLLKSWLKYFFCWLAALGQSYKGTEFSIFIINT